MKNLIFDSLSIEKGSSLPASFFTGRIAKTAGAMQNPRPEVPVYDRESLSRTRTLPTLKDAESMLIEEALKRACNNQTVAAQLLGMTRSALNKRLIRRRL